MVAVGFQRKSHAVLFIILAPGTRHRYADAYAVFTNVLRSEREVGDDDQES